MTGPWSTWITLSIRANTFLKPMCSGHSRCPKAAYRVLYTSKATMRGFTYLIFPYLDKWKPGSRGLGGSTTQQDGFVCNFVRVLTHGRRRLGRRQWRPKGRTWQLKRPPKAPADSHERTLDPWKQPLIVLGRIQGGHRRGTVKNHTRRIWQGISGGCGIWAPLRNYSGGNDWYFKTWIFGFVAAGGGRWSCRGGE